MASGERTNMKISDEIREWCDVVDVDADVCGVLRELADRIDSELVELPKDNAGKPIHIRDTVYTPRGSKAFVIGIRFSEHTAYVNVRTSEAEGDLALCPTYIFHSRPDSLERIADEIEAAMQWCDKTGNYGTGASSVSESTLNKWATSIRKLAEKKDDER